MRLGVGQQTTQHVHKLRASLVGTFAGKEIALVAKATLENLAS